MEANLSALNPFKLLSPAGYRPAHDVQSANHQPVKSGQHLDNGSVSISQQAQIAYSQSQSRESSIEIVTRDGDKVRISLNQSSSYQSRLQYAAYQDSTNQQLSVSKSQSQQTSADFSILVEGSLDSDEREAIEDLVKDIGKVAHQLYQGNTASAFKQAATLDYNTDELQSYSFDIKQSRTQNYVALYEQVAQYQPDVESRSSDLLQDSDLFDSLKEHIDQSIDSLKTFIEPGEVKSLLDFSSQFIENSFENPENHTLSIIDLLDLDIDED